MLLYIDPGTGSMLFTILFGIIGTCIYSLRMLSIKISFKVSGGKIKGNKHKIPFVIFSDDKRYWTVFEPICREMDKLGWDVVYMTASKDDPALNNPYSHIRAEFIGKGNRAFAKLNLLNAFIVLSTTPGLDVYQWKRSKNVQYYIHIPHAASDITLYRMFGIDYYDAILLSGEYQVQDIRNLEKLRNLQQKELKIIGIPYMDEMAVKLQKQESEKLVSEYSRTVLLAPSWGPSAIFSRYGGIIIEKLLQTGYHIIIRPHPQSFTSEKKLIDELRQQYPESEQLEWNRDSDNFDVLFRSDIMVSDFSGVIFDFALVHNKPVIYTAPCFDISPYDAWWLKTPLWTSKALPKIGCELTEDNMQNIKYLIDACLTEPKYAEGRRSLKRETWEHRGESAKLVAMYLSSKYNELKSSEKRE